MNKLFTAVGIERLRPPKEGRLEIGDIAVPGLGIRVTEKGVKSWSLIYRVSGAGGVNSKGRILKGKQRRMTLGAWPIIDLSVAREKARHALRLASEGHDPAISASISCFDGIHKDITEQAMLLMSEFVSPELPFEALIETARDRISNFATMLLAMVPAAGFPRHTQQFRTRYAAVFQQRMESALKDIRVGFVGGRKIVRSSPAPGTADAEACTIADAMILKPSFMGVGIDLRKTLEWIKNKWQHK